MNLLNLGEPKWKVLVVEDVPQQRETITEALQDLDLDVIDCQTVAEAILCLAQRQNDPFHVVLADMKIDGPKGGLEVIQKARSIDIYTEIIVMTHYATLENVYEAIQRGANQYLSKSLPNFLSTLTTVVQERAVRAHTYRCATEYFSQEEKVFGEIREALEEIKSMADDRPLLTVKPQIDAVLRKISHLI